MYSIPLYAFHKAVQGRLWDRLKKKKKKSCKIGRRTELKRQFGTGKQEPASRVDRNAGANTSVVAPKELYSWKYSELSENSLNYVLVVWPSRSACGIDCTLRSVCFLTVIKHMVILPFTHLPRHISCAFIFLPREDWEEICTEHLASLDWNPA